MCLYCMVIHVLSSLPPTLQLTADVGQRVSAGIAASEAAVHVSVRAVTDRRASVRRTHASVPRIVAPRRQSAPNAVSFERS